MNEFATNLISALRSPQSKKAMHAKLSQYFGHNYAVLHYLDQNLCSAVESFADKMRIELTFSEFIPGVNFSTQLDCFAAQFMTEQIKFIDDFVIKAEPDVYSIGDGKAGSRYTNAGLSPDHLLARWSDNAGRQISMRDDVQGLNCNPYYKTAPNCSRRSELGGRAGPLLTFCDQSNMGTQRHIEDYDNTTYKIALNRTSRPHENVPFGVSTIYSDARLLSRNIFRKNERGEENGIPRYEVALYNRDIDENLTSTEYGYKDRAFDMCDLYNRVGAKHASQNRSACRPRYSPYMHGAQ
jgi:hypothetical protein